MEPDLYRLMLGADDTLWADDADLKFGCRGRRTLGQIHRRPVDELGEDDHAARLGGIAQPRVANLQTPVLPGRAPAQAARPAAHLVS